MSTESMPNYRDDQVYVNFLKNMIPRLVRTKNLGKNDKNME